MGSTSNLFRFVTDLALKGRGSVIRFQAPAHDESVNTLFREHTGAWLDFDFGNIDVNAQLLSELITIH